MIELNLSGPGIQIRAALGDAALEQLLAIVQEHQMTEGELQGSGAGERRHRRRRHGLPEFKVVELDEKATVVRAQWSRLELDEVWRVVRAGSFPEKMTALVGWLESRGETAGRRAIRKLFALLQVPPPANPGRDLRAAARSGWIGGHEDAIRLSSEGWHHLGSILDDEGEASGGVLA